MAMIASATGVSGKRKEIYKYDAPWTIYGMNWSVRPDKRFRLALGSFVEEYNNKVRSMAILNCTFLWTELTSITSPNVAMFFRFRLFISMKKLQSLWYELLSTILIPQRRSFGYRIVWVAFIVINSKFVLFSLYRCFIVLRQCSACFVFNKIAVPNARV